MRDRLQTRGEETANAVSHGVGAGLGLIALPFLVWTAAENGTLWNVLAAAVFGLSVVLLYGSSMLYHALPHRWRKFKRRLQTMDHAAIYLLIAGSYTPFALGVLYGPVGWSVLALIWTLAAFGVFWKSARRTHAEWTSTSLYVGMGWLVIVVIVPLWEKLPPAALWLLITGGLFYTVGVLFYLANQWRYTHFIWHVFVLAGTACHVGSVLFMHLGPVSEF